jgi:hypothetical protein
MNRSKQNSLNQIFVPPRMRSDRPIRPTQFQCLLGKTKKKNAMSFFGYRKDSAPKQTQETHQSEVERLYVKFLAMCILKLQLD